MSLAGELVYQAPRFFVSLVRGFATALAEDGPRFSLQITSHRFDCGQAARAPVYLPLKSAFRFSRNAFTPSSLSSLEKQSANRSTSRRSPSSRFDREASFTASFASRSAIGLFSAIRFATSIVFASR